MIPNAVSKDLTLLETTASTAMYKFASILSIMNYLVERSRLPSPLPALFVTGRIT
jgi:hypothetical protein